MEEQETNPTPGDSGNLTETATQAGDSDVASVRELILGAISDLVPELVGGSNVSELIASVDVARQAYAAVSQQIKSAATAPISVPAGGGARREFVINIEELSPSAKIAEGLRRRNAKS